MTSNNLSWLVTVPTNDQNFKKHLTIATVDELRQALVMVEGQSATKTKVQTLQRELRKREKAKKQ